MHYEIIAYMHDPFWNPEPPTGDWSVASSGDPVPSPASSPIDAPDIDWEELGVCDSEQEHMVVRALLESSGIPCLGPDHFHDPKASIYSQLSICVPREQLETARALLDAQPIPQDASDTASEL